VSSWNDGRVEEDGEQFNKHVNVEEQHDLFSTDGGVFRSDVVEHDTRHTQSSNVHEASGYEDQGQS
jgi:hypothetical protein